MSGRIGVIVVALAVVAATSAAAPADSTRATAAAPCTSGSPGDCRKLLHLREGGLFAFYSNFTLTQPHPDVQRAIIVVHGQSRAVTTYFEALVTSASLARHTADTLVVAPFFQDPAKAPSGQLAWDSRWKIGGLSADQGPASRRRSSFEIVDRFMVLLLNRTNFPNLREIVVTGHSAGGQFAQRYAALNVIEPRATVVGVRVRYVVANPSSYMYLTAWRFVDNGFGAVTGDRATACPNWNKYPYGLLGRRDYVARFSGAEVRTRYPARLVTYLLGTADTKQDAALDRSCAAELEGTNRFARGKRFFAFMNRFFPANKHALQAVKRVGHNGPAMYESAEARQVLFAQVPG